MPFGVLVCVLMLILAICFSGHLQVSFIQVKNEFPSSFLLNTFTFFEYSKSKAL